LLEVQQLQQLLQQQGSEDWAEADQIHSLMLESNEVAGGVSPPARSLYLSIDAMQGYTSHVGVTQACFILMSGMSYEACHVMSCEEEDTCVTCEEEGNFLHVSFSSYMACMYPSPHT
jgi:hypothetical protein